MKVYRLPQLLEAAPDGRYTLEGEAVSMLYGRLAPGESDRKVPATGGCEHIIHIIKGEVRVRHQRSTFSATGGEAFITGEPVYLDNTGEGEVIYSSLSARHSTEEVKDGGDGPESEEAAEKSAEKDKEDPGPHG